MMIMNKREYHGHAKVGRKTTIYQRWSAMRARCNNQNNKHFHNYGGRGIKVCDRWDKSFLSFLEDVGDIPHGMQLDRINNDGDYEPSNVKWSTNKENSNNRRDTLYLTLYGITRKVSVWSKITGIKKQVLSQRVNKLGWTDQSALLTPVRCDRATINKQENDFLDDIMAGC